MNSKSTKSYNHQIYEKAYIRLNLSPTNRIIFQRLLGFLIRNDKPFPYSAVKLAEVTGFSLRTIFNSLNDLESLRLINRIGMGKNRKFMRGSILNKIMSTVQNRLNNKQHKTSTTVQLVHQKSINRATGAYKKTSLFLKHKDRAPEKWFEYQEYVSRFKSDTILGLKGKNECALNYDDWMETQML